LTIFFLEERSKKRRRYSLKKKLRQQKFFGDLWNSAVLGFACAPRHALRAFNSFRTPNSD
jgi:hypothetical protein